jgi:hypothetical protein
VAFAFASGLAVGAVALALARQGPAEPAWAGATAALIGAVAAGLVAGLEGLVARSRAARPVPAADAASGAPPA